MIHIIIWVVMFLVWYLYHTYKASVEENEEVYRAYEGTTVNDNKTEEDMSVGKCLDERTITGLVLSTLRKIGCEPEMETQGNLNYVYFTYQGEKFTIECNDDCFFIIIYDIYIKINKIFFVFIRFPNEVAITIIYVYIIILF